MTIEEKMAAAIDEFRNKNGIQWKSKLRMKYWSGEIRNEYLQMFRNRFIDKLDSIKYHTTKYEMLEMMEKR